MRNIAILGSTGSIGKQTIEVLSLHKDLYNIYALCVNSSVNELYEQALVTGAKVLGVSEGKVDVPDGLREREWFFGCDALVRIATLPEIDDVVVAVVGVIGLQAVIAARKAGKRVLLANKETLVAGGELVMSLCKDDSFGPTLLPVDSEHSAIFQCLQGEKENRIHKIWLTASGGPFREWSIENIRNATVEQALGHPTWKMGRKITIDSASMFNKALEIIEARWLFGVKPEQIQVAIHPQSIVHSMVEFEDGAIKAQLGVPDMRVPILYAVTYPERRETDVKRLDFESLSCLTFIRPDIDRFPAIGLAYECLKTGGASCCILNAANEIAANAFLKKMISFGRIYETVNETLQRIGYLPACNFDDIIQADQLSRSIAGELIRQ